MCDTHITHTGICDGICETNLTCFRHAKVSKRNSRENTRKTYKESVAAYAEQRKHTNKTQYRQPKFRMSKVFVVITMAHVYIGIANNIPYVAQHTALFPLHYWQKSYIWLNIHRNHAQYTRKHTISFGAPGTSGAVVIAVYLILLPFSLSVAYFGVLTLLMNDVGAAAAVGFFPAISLFTVLITNFANISKNSTI